MDEGKLTEDQLRRLTPEQRRAYPRDVLFAAGLTTRERAHEILTMEGWEFVGMDERFRDEPDHDPADESEVWRRQVGGRVEWCDCHPNWVEFLPPGHPPDQNWYRMMYPYDPRTIEY